MSRREPRLAHHPRQHFNLRRLSGGCSFRPAESHSGSGTQPLVGDGAADRGRCSGTAHLPAAARDVCATLRVVGGLCRRDPGRLHMLPVVAILLPEWPAKIEGIAAYCTATASGQAPASALRRVRNPDMQQTQVTTPGRLKLRSRCPLSCWSPCSNNQL